MKMLKRDFFFCFLISKHLSSLFLLSEYKSVYILCTLEIMAADPMYVHARIKCKERVREFMDLLQRL